nr:MAG TPA: hypothetical protein [Bacteriophage sp.]
MIKKFSVSYSHCAIIILSIILYHKILCISIEYIALFVEICNYMLVKNIRFISFNYIFPNNFMLTFSNFNKSYRCLLSISFVNNIHL